MVVLDSPYVYQGIVEWSAVFDREVERGDLWEQILWLREMGGENDVVVALYDSLVLMPILCVREAATAKAVVAGFAPWSGKRGACVARSAAHGAEAPF